MGTDQIQHLSRYDIMRLFARIIIISLSILNPVFGDATPDLDSPEFSRQAYEGARDLARDLVERYSPQEHYFLGLGRSPAPVIEVLRSLKLKSVDEMPFSNGKAISRAGINSDPRLQRRLIEHFKKFLPGKKALAGRELVVLDYAHTGQGVEGALEAIRWYYAKTCPECRFRMVAVTGPSHAETNLPRVEKATGIKIDQFQGSKYPGLWASLKDQRHDGLTRYGQYEVAYRDIPADLTNPNYKLGEIIQKYIATDPQRLVYKAPRKKTSDDTVSPLVKCYREALK